MQWALLCNHPQSAGAGVRTLAGIARAALKAPEPPLSESGADPGAPSTREGHFTTLPPRFIIFN